MVVVPSPNCPSVLRPQVNSVISESVAAGRYHTTAIRSGNILFTWGLGTSGQLGDGTILSKSSPVQIGSRPWTVVSAGLSHTVGIS